MPRLAQFRFDKPDDVLSGALQGFRAVRALLPIGTPAPDLDGLTAEISGEVTAQGEDGNSEGLLGGFFVTEKSVFKHADGR